MGLADALIRILDEYPAAKRDKYTGHPLASYIRNDLRALIESNVSRERYRTTASAGQGGWVAAPWAAIMDIFVTNTAQSGFYPVYLFNEDFSAVVLSLNQGVTAVRKAYGADARVSLRASADNFAARYGPPPPGFHVGAIDLAAGPGSDAKFYEVGSIFARSYHRASFPTDEELLRDLLALMDVYRMLVDKDVIPTSSPECEDDESDFEDTTRIRHHKRIERNQALARRVKKLKGYKCEVCDFTYSSHYRGINTDYIEAHHLVPLAELSGGRIRLNPRTDFAVLCANCHRMIHRASVIHDIAAFRQLHCLPCNLVNEGKK